ncbi:porin [Limnohabitans sp. TS-CS-82]|uniref:porin n=1 Tax=Limnohabitans sp. TS-CS-82 TaxID=2094193 RepID=UPI001374CC15|nr:porin [Limnohabitans sp. TS-CS-82]
MKKTLVAIAALAAFGAQAQSSVQIIGTMDAGYQAIDYKGTSVTGFNGNGSSTSGFKFLGTEDLGGGLKASFIVGTDWNVVSRSANTGAATATTAGDASATTGTFGNGELSTGLSGKFGAVTIGHLAFNTLTTTGTGQPFGTAIGGGYGSIYRVNAAASLVRDDNAFRYLTPTFSGFTGSFYKSNKQTKTGTGVAADTNFNAALGAYDKLGSQEIGVNYANGPLAASYSSLKQDSKSVGAGVTESTVNTLGANYTMGAAKFMFLNQTNKNTGAATTATTVDTAYTALSATYTMGQTVLMATTGSLKAKAGDFNGKKSTITGLGADYNLSKMTALYARYESIKDEAGVISAAGNGNFTKAAGNDTRTRTAVGVRYNF